MKVTFKHEADNNKNESITDTFDIDPGEFALMIATDELRAAIDQFEQDIVEMEAELDAMIHANQTTAQDQDAYLLQFTALEARYQQAIVDKRQAESDVEIRESRRASITAAYQQIADQPISTFRPPQWTTAVIDYATVSEESIAFTFKTGGDIVVSL